MIPLSRRRPAPMLGNLKSQKLIVIKGLLFGVCLLLSAIALLLQNLSWQTAALIALLAWSSARLYYLLVLRAAGLR